MPMPSLARLVAPGILHHVIGWNIERNEIFVNDKDKELATKIRAGKSRQLGFSACVQIFLLDFGVASIPPVCKR
jgi:hypothetical protein